MLGWLGLDWVWVRSVGYGLARVGLGVGWVRLVWLGLGLGWV